MILDGSWNDQTFLEKKALESVSQGGRDCGERPLGETG